MRRGNAGKTALRNPASGPQCDCASPRVPFIPNQTMQLQRRQIYPLITEVSISTLLSLSLSTHPLPIPFAPLHSSGSPPRPFHLRRRREWSCSASGRRTPSWTSCSSSPPASAPPSPPPPPRRWAGAALSPFCSATQFGSRARCRLLGK